MANLDAPRGFVPSRYLSGAAWNGAMNLYVIPSTDGSIYSPGDAVKTVVGSDANGVPYIVKAAGTDILRGVIVGFLAAAPNAPSLVGTNLDLTVQNLPATKAKDYYAMVVDDPAVLFEIQDDGLAALTATASNKNASFTVANPTAPAQNSASVLATGTVAAANAALNLKLIGLVQKPDNAFGVNAKWLVMINLHELRGASVGF
jgi:hypothetical protein